MIEDTSNQLNPSWSELLKNTVSVETSHSSPRKLENLKKEDLVVLQDLVANTNGTNTVHHGKAIVALVERSPTIDVANLLDKVIADPIRPQSERALAAIEMRRLPKEAAEQIASYLIRRYQRWEPLYSFQWRSA